MQGELDFFFIFIFYFELVGLQCQPEKEEQTLLCSAATRNPEFCKASAWAVASRALQEVS